ncbi:MAG: efflux RND transporter periplasmic adaptor subunit [Desulfomonile tiedjei]|uniref:Efflux RND transporter periplasmic adaptor subunit n=1 Tax=Desulfomonile tiedjei TaxID=2358 RepID=A0A9D6V776_9BACT|nr:efflux RND transporter periplasmic adaptor subunit [Desulfomonile tiedjei]
MSEKRWKRKLLLILVCSAVVALAVGIFAVNGSFSSKPKQDYKLAKVLKRDLGATVQATGIVKPLVGAEVKVGARTPGKVVELPINVGDKVVQGQVIAKIEQDDLIAKVKLQDAILAEATAEETRLSKDYLRDTQLHSSVSISAQKMDLTEALYAIAKARKLKAQAELDVAKAQLSYATITAPIKGTVASVNTIQGETVTTGLNSPTFIKIIDLDRLEVLAYVDENDIGKVKLDQDSIFTVAAHPSVEFKGKVTSIYPSATIQDNVVYYMASVSVDNTEGKLMPDMTTNVLIFLEQRKGVLTVPNKAVQREGQRKFVLAMEKGTPEKRFVDVGWKDQSYTEISDGLREGDLVVIGDMPRK